MVRRSARLQDAGYYTEEGIPHISYKECLQRIFRRRIYRKRRENIVDPPGGINFAECQDETLVVNESRQPERRRVRWSSSMTAITISILIMLFLGMCCGHFLLFQRVEMFEGELRSVKAEFDRFTPVTDSVPNFGEESLGARVHSHLSSPSYVPCKELQRKVIQGRSILRPGECWCFPGKQGHLVVELSHPVAITEVTLAHISKSQDPRGLIASAPREFSIYGMRTLTDEGTHLGRRIYDDNGKPIQRFTLQNPDGAVFRFLKLKVENNYGQTDFTCIYHLKVHGNLSI